MSARIRPGRFALASVTAAECVRATPITRWPRLSTRPSRSMAMKVSSSMMRTSVAISAASSRPDSSTRARNVGHFDSENVGGVLLREAFQRHQQEGLAGLRRDLAKPLLDRLLRRAARLGALVDPDRIPDFREKLVERGPRPVGPVQDAGILESAPQGRPPHRHRPNADCRSGRAHSGAETADAGQQLEMSTLYTLPIGR